MVNVHYSCASTACLKHKPENTRDEEQLISVTYAVITLLLNTVTYTLRNEGIKRMLCEVLWAGNFPDNLARVLLRFLISILGRNKRIRVSHPGSQRLVS
jgi:hypothetical protein